MSIFEFWSNLTNNGTAGWMVAGILILLSLIEISPLKVNPLGAILGWIGKRMNSSLETKFGELRKQVQEMWVNQHRQSILTFARECRANIPHSSDEWSNILSIAADYEVYCEKNAVSNGVVRADTEYIRNLYQELSRDRRL